MAPSSHDPLAAGAPAERIKDYAGTDYRTVWEKPDAIFSGRFEDELARRLLPSAPGWFIDIGAGYGRLYPLYARPGRRVVLVDYAPHLLELAAEAIPSSAQVSFVAANAYHLPFRPQVFAAGLSVRTYHHMSAPEHFLAECARVLQPAAHLVLEYSNKRSAVRTLRHPRSSLRVDHEEYGQLLFGTHPTAFRRMAADAGLELQRREGTGFLSRFVSRSDPPLQPALALAERALDRLLGPIDLAPMSFVDLERTGRAAAAEPPGESLAEILQCPACAGALKEEDGAMSCAGCGRVYPWEGQVLDCRHLDPAG